jgi:glycine betaine/proline transport system permease protein
MIRKNIHSDFILWLGIIIATLVLIVTQDHITWFSTYPKVLIVPIDSWLNTGMEMLIAYLGWFFMGISWLLEWPITFVRIILQSVPWSVDCFYRCRLAPYRFCSCLMFLYGGDRLLV